MTDIAATAADRLTAQRLRVIAAIHALAQFLLDFPDVPTPTNIDVWAHLDSANGTDQERIASLDRLADAHDGVRKPLGSHEYTYLYLGTSATHGTDLRFIHATTRKES